jgi:hypothetical protein
MLEQILESYPEETFLKIDGHDNAILGVDETTMRLCYSVNKIIENLMVDMDEDEAVEYYDFNIAGAYMGEQTPILVQDRF